MGPKRDHVGRHHMEDMCRVIVRSSRLRNSLRIARRIVASVVDHVAVTVDALPDVASSPQAGQTELFGVDVDIKHVIAQF